MKVPNVDQALVPREKVAEYLLNPDHPVGRTKAAFFTGHGFIRDSWGVLADALRGHLVDHEVSNAVETTFGTKYVIEGPLLAPDGRKPLVRSIWMIDLGTNYPRFVSAYPRRKEGKR